MEKGAAKPYPQKWIIFRFLFVSEPFLKGGAPFSKI